MGQYQDLFYPTLVLMVPMWFGSIIFPPTDVLSWVLLKNLFSISSGPMVDTWTVVITTYECVFITYVSAAISIGLCLHVNSV